MDLHWSMSELRLSQTRYLWTLINSAKFCPRAKSGLCLHGYRSGTRDGQLSSIPGWCMRRYPVIEIRYTSAFIVSSRHNNARGINSTREKSASDDIYIDVMHASFYMRYRSRKLNFIRTRERINYVKSERRSSICLGRKKTMTLKQL